MYIKINKSIQVNVYAEHVGSHVYIVNTGLYSDLFNMEMDNMLLNTLIAQDVSYLSMHVQILITLYIVGVMSSQNINVFVKEKCYPCRISVANLTKRINRTIFPSGDILSQNSNSDILPTLGNKIWKTLT